MTVHPFLRRAWRVAGNLRMLALFLIGPAAGVIGGGVIFGLPPDLRWATGAALLVSLSMFGLLVRGEWRRLSANDGSAVR